MPWAYIAPLIRRMGAFDRHRVDMLSALCLYCSKAEGIRSCYEYGKPNVCALSQFIAALCLGFGAWASIMYPGITVSVLNAKHPSHQKQGSPESISRAA
jgi:hypothetical protein